MDEKKFAVLIDSDNVSHRYIKTIMDEITNVGVPTIKRIYGDWTTGEKQGWKNILLEYALTPVQQYGYTTGKNSTDSAMIIDAMDILYTGDVDGFCLASSDSDFTRLATRLREAGKTVIGMGERKTPSPFVKACSQFKYIDVLTASPDKKTAAKNPAKAKKSPKTENVKPEPVKAEPSKQEQKAKVEKVKPKEEPKRKGRHVGNAKSTEAEQKPVEVTELIATDEQTKTEQPPKDEDSATPLYEIEEAIRKIIEDSDEESGLIPASRVGLILQNRYPDFDTRNYGCRRMTDLLKLLNVPTVSFNDPNNPVPNAALLYVKVK